MLMVNGSVPHPHRAPNILLIFPAPALEFLPVDVERCLAVPTEKPPTTPQHLCTL
jgi:hypothetical protein